MKEVADLNDTLRREGEEAARKRGDHARRFHSNGGDQQAASERPVDAHAYAGYSGTAADKPNGKQLVVQRASDITPEAVDWLWSGRLAAGKTTLVGGDPGLGKSQLAISIAATITRGGQWPCGEGAAPKCSVVILCAEDGAADTVVPRLMAAGADRDKIHIVTAVHEADGKGRRLFNLSKDLDILERLINKIGMSVSLPSIRSMPTLAPTLMATKIRPSARCLNRSRRWRIGGGSRSSQLRTSPSSPAAKRSIASSAQSRKPQTRRWLPKTGHESRQPQRVTRPNFCVRCWLLARWLFGKSRTRRDLLACSVRRNRSAKANPSGPRAWH